MPLNVFISWSGERSRIVAEGLCSWLPDVVQGIQPWISRQIELGSHWAEKVAQQLEVSSIGILCLTRDNLDNPWITFEAGALAKAVQLAHVCPYLIDVDPKEFTESNEPLSQFQAVSAGEEGTYQLLTFLNSALDEPLNETRLRRSFERWWPDLDAVLRQLPPASAPKTLPHTRNLGLEAVFPNRGEALNHMLRYLDLELTKDRASSRLWIVASSFKGLREASVGRFDGRRFLEQVAASDCHFRLLLTDPEFADFRAKQELRGKGEIEREISSGIALLRRTGIARECVKYYRGTPTVFAIATTDHMLLNPYPYERESQRCFALVVQDTRSTNDIFDQYLHAHFEMPWRHARKIPSEEWMREP